MDSIISIRSSGLSQLRQSNSGILNEQWQTGNGFPDVQNAWCRRVVCPNRGAFFPSSSLQESSHGNSSSFAPHKLHFHCDSSACPARQPVATLAINLVSENAVRLFGAEGIGTLMKRLLSKKTKKQKTQRQNNATVHFWDHVVLFQPSNVLYLRKRQVMIIWAEVHF